MNDALERKALEAVSRLGLVRPRDLARLGLPREHVKRLADRGALVRVARGLYADPDGSASTHPASASSPSARRTTRGGSDTSGMPPFEAA